MYQWPVIDQALIDKVNDQLRTSLSDKGSTGIIKRTEERLASYYGSKYCLLFSSATGAMHSLVFALDLSPGDAIIAPVYTFFATASPFSYEGVRVIFCDSDENGQLSVEDLKQKYNADVKAVLCTHMWGIPSDLDPIRQFCDEKNIALVEDCSHAHTARYRDAFVGRFGRASVFSTNQKFLTSGEGGFLLTDDRAIYERCLLLAHYNDRCQRELTDPTLRQYALTGMGLKYRAHPLAVAILDDQLDRIDRSIEHRKANYSTLFRAVQSNPALQNIVPDYSHVAGLYVFPFLARDGATRKSFMAHCQARGNTAFDVPESTKPLNREPLFRDNGLQVRGRYRSFAVAEDSELHAFPGADEFHSRIVKLPLWGHEGDSVEVAKAAEAIATFS